MPGVCAVSLFDLASQNLLSPMVLFFVLGLLAALAWAAKRYGPRVAGNSSVRA